MHDVNDEAFELTGSDTFVPVAEPLVPDSSTPPDETAPVGLPTLPHGCHIDAKEGCYRISYVPHHATAVFNGTMRVDKSAGQGPTTVSGDLYRFLALPTPDGPLTSAALTAALAGPTTAGDGPGPLPFPIPLPISLGIPAYPRSRYFSYLQVTKMGPSVIGPCRLIIVASEFNYTQPPAGSFDGSFPSTPTRTVTIALTPQAPPVGFAGPFFSGTLSEGGTERGAFTMGWVSPFMRKATLEVDTLAGAIAPDPVPAPSGGGTEDFRTVFATAGWDLTVLRDRANIPAPAGVTPTSCWSAADLHAVMVANRSPAANLDQVWWIHLLMVPAQMGCGRGVMYDTIGVPREGVASFSDDGYPPSDSANFGAAANKKQRDVPRAFLRSACHEVGHGFNQQHQEITSIGEPGRDNSIMTTSPGVADTLAGPATGDPGVFPTEIHLGFNDHVRHHLIHFPDPVVRPGGMSFGTGHSPSFVPTSDTERFYFEPDQMTLTLTPESRRIKLGQPLSLSWDLVNHTGYVIPTPTDVRRESLHAQVAIVDPNGVTRSAPPATIMSDGGTIGDLPPGEKRGAKTTLFYSSRGFAFRTPGAHAIKMQVVWDYGGIPLGVRAQVEVWVDYPVSDADNEVAAAMMNPDVGAMVAMGGKLHHLPEAGEHLGSVVERHPEHPAFKALGKHMPARKGKAKRAEGEAP